MRRSASSSLRVAGGRSGGRAGLGGGLRCPRARSGGARAGQSAAATHSLTASAGARWPLRFCYRLVASNPLCHQTYTLCRTVFGVLSALALAKAESLFGRGKIERTRPAAHEPAQDSSEYSGGTGLCVTLTVSATGRRAPAHPHKPPKASHAAAATTRAEAQHNLQNKLEVHPREPLLPRQIDKAFTSERRLQQRRPRLIQFEPHALALPPQYQGRPV